MARISIVVGMFLSTLSAVAMLFDPHKHPAQFFPLMFGIPVLICGVAGLNPHRRRVAMHIAASIALLGLLFSMGSVAVWARSQSQQDPPNASILFVSVIMALTEIAFVTTHLVTRYGAHFPATRDRLAHQVRSTPHPSGILNDEESKSDDHPPTVPAITASHDP